MDPVQTSPELSELLSIASRKLRTSFNAMVAAHGLTYSRALALLHLSRRPCRTQKDLGEDLDLENATVVRLLDGMERLGLIRRKPVEGDRRAKHVVLTEHGREQAALVSRIIQELRGIVLTGIDPADVAVTKAVLRMITANLEQAAVEHADA
ncbi:MarR family winged helix-turn-helix transcriptional regulator [Consotaella salsifontis]|uniref:Transcriptional regulator, MarR family n=1 Tax=Consotaella salsifontis TaxID=1365950 RepID=A0A1T4PWL1_9HYPH|nr:MarR family transcriptional regulator [Consotaella salsifontis]SJZ95756.1 transcriptional regulator, MarR family [Consotaella salsifontis]